jgi:hypothetical protein
MAFNLIRNSRVFFTTNVSQLGVVQTTGFTTSNTFEIQVLDGFSFSQTNQTETITLSEAGPAPVRGQRSFNTSLDPVEFTFSTYIRPQAVGTSIVAEEAVLWNALASATPIGTAGSAWTNGVVAGETGAGPALVNFDDSNRHQLQTFGMIMLVDNVAYVIDNCALDQASLDFGIDAIGSIAWTGRGTKMRQIVGVTATQASPVVFANGLTGQAKYKDVTAKYIANKLSTMTIQEGIGGTGTSYTIAITGGNLTVANNLTYLTPANLGTVNEPITYFTGTRGITGSVTCYLRTGSNTSAALLQDMLATATTSAENKYQVEIKLGGETNPNRVELLVDAAMLKIPTVSAEQVVSTTIEFMPQAYDGTNYELEETNELVVKYFSV